MANKLELNWYGKDNTTIVEPRILIERPELSHSLESSSLLSTDIF